MFKTLVRTIRKVLRGTVAGLLMVLSVLGIATLEPNLAIWSEWLTRIDPRTNLSESQEFFLLLLAVYLLGAIMQSLLMWAVMRWRKPLQEKIQEKARSSQFRLLEYYQRVIERILGASVEFWYLPYRGARKASRRKRFRLRPGQSTYITTAWTRGSKQDFSDRDFALIVKPKTSRYLLRFFRTGHDGREIPLVGARVIWHTRDPTQPIGLTYMLHPRRLEEHKEWPLSQIKVVLERHIM